MTDFEKIEKLREHADVTFEDAKAALEAANGDLLDAIIWLERNGKVKGPAESTHSTKYEDQAEYVSVSEKVKQSKKEKAPKEKKEKDSKDFSENMFVQGVKRVWNFLIGNSFVVSKNGKDYVVLPLLLARSIEICSDVSKSFMFTFVCLTFKREVNAASAYLYLEICSIMGFTLLNNPKSIVDPSSSTNNPDSFLLYILPELSLTGLL